MMFIEWQVFWDFCAEYFKWNEQLNKIMPKEKITIAGIDYTFDRLGETLPPSTYTTPRGRDEVYYSPEEIYKSEDGNEISILGKITSINRPVKRRR